MTEETKVALATAMVPRLTKYVPHLPFPKQAAFLLLDHREVFFGGSAGPGKTDALLMAALQYVDVPRYAALLLRRNYKQLSMPGSLIPRSHEWLDGTDARWHEGRKQWLFPSGATLTFGFVSSAGARSAVEEDVRKFETAEFQYVGIDEVTAWPESDYRFLFSRLRRLRGMPVPIRMRSASNPTGRGRGWVKRRFVDPLTRLRRAVFIPALLSDNPALDQDEYVEALRELHPVMWRRLLHGDWDAADPGEMFLPREWLMDEHFLDTVPEVGVVKRARYWDLAASEETSNNPDPDWTAGVRFARLANGLTVIEHMVRVRENPARVEATFARVARDDPPNTTQYVEQAPGAGKALVDHFRRNVCPTDVMFRGDPVSGRSKAVRARPFAAAMGKGKVLVVRGDWNEPLFDEMEAFSEDPAHSGAHDDQVDACAGAYAKVRIKASAGSSLGA